MLATISPILPVWGWLIISVLFYGIGEYISKTWANSPSSIEVLGVITANALSAFFWLPALFADNKLAVIGMAWLVLAALSTITIGILFFKEQLSFVQWIAVGMAIVAFVLLVTDHY